MQTLEVYDPLVAEVEAVLEHRRVLVEARTLLLHHVGDQLAKLPTDVRDQLPTVGKLESRLRQLETIDTTTVSTRAGAYRVSWLLPLIDQDRRVRREIRALERRIDELLDEHGTTLRDEPGVGPITAATLLCEVGDPFRFAREAKFARWSGTGSRSHPAKATASRSATDSTPAATGASTARCTSSASPNNASTPTRRRIWPARPPRARPDAKPAAPTNASWPTASSAACGATNTPAARRSRPPLDKGELSDTTVAYDQSDRSFHRDPTFVLMTATAR